ncbi:TIGR02452 family protein [Myxococcota bacterium]|nr:TIGR02452 family protein [Myxococcota bacterium]
MSLKEIARQTLEIIERGAYSADDGRVVDIQAEIQAAIRGTKLYRPAQLEALLTTRSDGAPPKIEVTGESTQEAAHRLAQSGPVALLNFASARNPGGGFINGAKAQEEDLSRCSALYPCQLTQMDYYSANRQQKNLLYTDHIIYSPRVPFFRIKRQALLDAPFMASVITAPAPNAGQVRRRVGMGGAREIEATLRRRAAMVLATLRAEGERRVILGAWGCGVFQNDPGDVADAFGACLTSDGGFAGAFDEVVFAVYQRKEKPTANFLAFQRRFG